MCTPQGPISQIQSHCTFTTSLHKPSLQDEVLAFHKDLSKIQLQTLSNIRQKRKSDNGSGIIHMELEWCGTSCSGKYYTVLIPYNQSTKGTYVSMYVHTIYMYKIYDNYVCILMCSKVVGCETPL